MKATTEKAFEAYIEETLASRGWDSCSNLLWDKNKALIPEEVINFIKDTQGDLWTQMEKLHGEELPAKLVEALTKERDAKGTLHVLRHGFKFYGKTFKLGYFKPAHGLNKETLELFGKNRLTVTRQAPCHSRDNSTVDMVLSMNGIPVATLEIKNPGTGQNWKNAVHQYKTDRDPREPLFRFKKGALVHFAVDPDEVHMATHLNREKTFFLPFNRGSHPGEIQCGKGNPQHPSGHRTGYFWEDILERESFIDIIGSFIFLETSEQTVSDGMGGRKKVSRETMIFPRYHQLDAVRKLIRIVREEAAGQNYLIQHSAGSGKTNSISWLSHRLSSLHTEADEKIFDCVVVITDRKVLDKQLQDAIYQIEHAQGVVKPIDENSRQLAEALVDGTKIVVTTLQKFPFVLRGLLHIAGAEDPDNPDEASITRAKEWEEKITQRTYAVIVDEAHSSQTGETARELKKILGAGTDQGAEEAEIDWEDGLNRIMESRGRQKNLSFFAFTATPKGKTLELFGRKGDSGKPEAIHTYSMRQAIEEDFILDVLKNYTTYKTYFRLLQTAESDPKMPKKKAMKKLTKFLHLHPYNIEQKTEIIVEHFRQHVKQKLNGMAKAMVVTGSRLQAIRYMLSFQRYIAENHYKDIRPLVAFSGTVKDPDSGIEYTEPGMNIDVVTGKNISESQLPDKFDTSDYQILLVANKYQTGFDQPLLCAMYVDKRLDGVQAVQTLSRLNRTYGGKEPPFVLDFVNETEGIYEAFKPYYDATTLQEASDPGHLEVLKHELDSFQVYYWSEVEAFAQIFYLPLYKQNPSDHARMQKYIQPAVDRYRGLDDEQKEGFYEKITAYVRFYSFISQIIPYSDKELEMLYSFGRFLIPHLDAGDDGVNPHPEKEVVLEYYRIEKAMSGSIVVEDETTYGVKSPTAVGTGRAKDEEKPLSEIIQALNERFGTDFKEEDRLFFEQIKEKAGQDERVIQTAKTNSLEKFQLGIRKIIESLMMQRMAENDQIVTKYMDDDDFQKTVFPILARAIYKDIREREIVQK
ncbi:MAG TPA: type I restriction endonuclease [Syntrophorhabdaceae bacterium]|nr:type I restriction endonuclease [Syntrophorhabdaceae bacterium]HQM80766.1 type I restriction endonuclease [Syntrophorhabdaceae bacterium]